jgi:DNA recombination protein RmuC
MPATLLIILVALVGAAILLLLLLLVNQSGARQATEGMRADQSAFHAQTFKQIQTVLGAQAAFEKSVREAVLKTKDESTRIAAAARSDLADSTQRSMQMVSGQLVELAEAQKTQLECLTRQFAALTVSTEARLEELRATTEQRLDAPGRETRQRIEELRALFEDSQQKAAEAAGQALDEANMAVSQLQQLVHGKLSDALAVQRSQVDSVLERLAGFAEGYVAQLAALKSAVDERLVSYGEDNERRLTQSLASLEAQVRTGLDSLSGRAADTAAVLEQLRGAVSAVARDSDAQKNQMNVLSERFASALAGNERQVETLRAALDEKSAAQLHQALEATSGQMNEVVARQDARLDSLAGQLTSLAEAQEKLSGTVGGYLDEVRGAAETGIRSSLEKQRAEVTGVLHDYQAVVERNAADVQVLVQEFAEFRGDLARLKTIAEAVAARPAAPGPAEPKPGQSSAIPGRSGNAVLLPGGNGRPGEFTWLPIDARYPVGVYERLTRARAAGDTPAVVQAEAELENGLMESARAMHQRYADVPNTAGFSILFLPVEGLYAEVLQHPGLCRALHQEYRVVVAGPSTLETLLADTARRAAAPAAPALAEPPTPQP